MAMVVWVGDGRAPDLAKELSTQAQGSTELITGEPTCGGVSCFILVFG